MKSILSKISKSLLLILFTFYSVGGPTLVSAQTFDPEFDAYINDYLNSPVGDSGAGSSAGSSGSVPYPTAESEPPNLDDGSNPTQDMIDGVGAYAKPTLEYNSNLLPDTYGLSEAGIGAEFAKTLKQIQDAGKTSGGGSGGSGSNTSQAYAYANGASSTSAGVSVGSQVGGAAGCIAGQLLSTILQSSVGKAISTVTNFADQALGYAASLFTVPISEWGTVKWDAQRTKEQLQMQSAATVGTSLGFAGFNNIVAPGWDAVGYCIVNSIINYIADSTIAWARSGFNGNPAFIENPGQFFKQLADVEASSFLQGLAYGVMGQNICEPFRAQMVLTIAQDYLGTQGNYVSGGGATGGYNTGGYSGTGAASRTSVAGSTYGGCSLDDIKGNFKSFLKGNFNKGGWSSWFQVSQVPSNNPYTTYLNLSANLGGTVQKKQQLANLELGWGKGFLSFRRCEDKNQKDQSKCPITTPGNIIEGQLSKTLGVSKDRLVLAERFDQVIKEVVNALIKTALNRVLDKVN